MKDELATKGIVVPDDWLTLKQVEEIFTHLADEFMWMGGHVTRYAGKSAVTTAMFLADPEAHYPNSLACYEFSASVRCPHLIETALRYADLIEDYFQREPVLYSVNLFWSFPGGRVPSEVQGWHRDVDDSIQAAMFFYLTPVTTEEAHLFREGTHVPDMGDVEREIVGDRGMFFIENPYGYHMGRHPQHNARLMAWARFGVSDPPQSYSGDGLYQVEHPALWDRLDEKHRRITRHILKESACIESTAAV